MLGNSISLIAVGLGFADPAEADFDSTVQEANIGYPSDAVLMKKLAEKVHHVAQYLRGKTKIFTNAIAVSWGSFAFGSG